MAQQDQYGIYYDSIDEYVVESFIAVGGESIVFKARKIAIKRTFALKIQVVQETWPVPRNQWEDFQQYELDVYARLEHCSTSRLAGIIREIPRNVINQIIELIPEQKMQSQTCQKLLNKSLQYFAIVEDYIYGSDLEVYCRGISDGAQPCAGHTPGRNANYAEVVKFQRLLISWIKQFCEIMTQVSVDKHYLHLDIKPSNLMVTADTGTLIVIDFGHAVYLGDQEDKTKAALGDYFGEGVIGTDGYSAPECCNTKELRGALNYTELAEADVRSDIFSFGAALWECVNPDPNLKIEQTENGYFRRDFFNAPTGYIQEFEDIIVKCTEKDPRKRYQSYKELRDAAEYAEHKLNARDKPKVLLLKMLYFLAGLFVVVLIFSMITSSILLSLSFEDAQLKFQNLAEVYQNSDVKDYRERALAYVKEKPERTETYDDVLDLAYNAKSLRETGGDTVRVEEFREVLLPCLAYTEDKELKEKYMNTVFSHTSSLTVRGLAETVRSEYAKDNSVLKDLDSCSGMRIAKAVYCCNRPDDTLFAEKYIDIYRELTDLWDHPDAEYDYTEALIYIAKQLRYNKMDAVPSIAKDSQLTKDTINRRLEEIIGTEEAN